MTANKLADKLVESNSVSWGNCTHEQHDNDKYFKEQAATMLRQQQAEIEALKLRELYTRNKRSEGQMKEKYTFGWHDPRSLYGELKVIEEDKPNEPNVPTWFRLAVKVFYWLKKGE